jgi:tetraacyldisaccharide 4'-kinase
MKLSELYWHRVTPLHVVLWPLSVLYRFFSLMKKLCYWLDIFPPVKLTVPVIVVDSISIEDSGKTPLLLWLIDSLLAHGYHPGIITRGNQGNSGPPVAVTSADSLPHSGGKAFLLAQLCGTSCPVWVGNDRIAAAQALLDAHPECNVIISNDGLQYYRLERDIEVIAVDFAEHSFGNGLLLPAGPLRIALKDVGKSSIIVTSNSQNHYVDTNSQSKTYNMKLVNETAYQVLDPHKQKAITDFRNESIQAITDADNAHWFFELLQKTDLKVELHAYAENHRFTPQEIHFADHDIVLMPEENALQCKDFAHGKLWAVPKKAWVNSELQSALLRKLRDIPTA